MHRDILRSLYLAASFCPGSANGVHIVLAGRYRRRHEDAGRPRLRSRRIVEPDLGARRQTHIDRHGLCADWAWGNRGVITSRVLVSRSIGWRAIVSAPIGYDRRSVSRFIASRAKVTTSTAPAAAVVPVRPNGIPLILGGRGAGYQH